MPTILNELQTRAEEARKRLDEANKTFQTAQQSLQVAQHNFNTWSAAMQAEARREEMLRVVATEGQLPLPQTSVAQADADTNAQIEHEDTADAANKTDIVRELLHTHPAGMSAIEIWKQVSTRFKYRPYLYSVLKRLRDRDEVSMRRGKYCLKLATKVEEVKNQQAIVH